ncbi:hypothetical protein LguiA_003805 [Lonicera macranthoides]
MKHVPKQDENSIVLDSIGESDEEITNDKPLAVSRGSPQIGSPKRFIIRLRERDRKIRGLTWSGFALSDGGSDGSDRRCSTMVEGTRVSRRASVLARERIVSLPKKVGTLDDMPVRVPVRSGRYLYGETQGRMICVCHGRVWRGLGLPYYNESTHTSIYILTQVVSMLLGYVLLYERSPVLQVLSGMEEGRNGFERVGGRSGERSLEKVFKSPNMAISDLGMDSVQVGFRSKFMVTAFPV